MKTALCLYGQPRNFKQNWKYISDNIISPNNCDVFFHTWYDENDLNFRKMTPGHENRQADSDLKIILPSTTNSKDFLIQSQIPFYRKEIFCSDENFEACWPWAKIYDRESFLKDRIFSHYSMWYSINQSILLKELYSQRNQFTYDSVIIMRFDVSPKKVIDINSLNLQNVISDTRPLPRNEISDWLIISNNINSNLIGSLFFTIDYHRNNLILNNNIWTNEAYLREQLKIFNINVDFENFEVTF